jgi:hypothetical protein
MTPEKVDVANNPMPSGNTPSATEKDASTEPIHAATAAGGTTRLAMALNTPASSSGTADVYSLASLRASLRKQNETSRTVNVDFGMNDRRQMLDVYRSRF